MSSQQSLSDREYKAKEWPDLTKIDALQYQKRLAYNMSLFEKDLNQQIKDEIQKNKQEKKILRQSLKNKGKNSPSKNRSSLRNSTNSVHKLLSKGIGD